MQPDKLTPQLSVNDLKANIDAMRSQNVPVEKIQSYVNNYSLNSTGQYTLKAPTTTPVTPVPTDTTTTPPAPDNGLLSFVSNAGKDLGQALTAGKATQTIATNTQNHANDIQALSDKVAAMKTAGQDPTAVQNMLNTLLKDSPSNYGGNLTSILPAAAKTNEQIVGDFSSLGAGLLTAAGGLSPVVSGAALGLTHALSSNKGVGGALVDTAVGGLAGKIAQVGFDKVAPYLTQAISTYGTPLVEKLAQFLPEDAIPALKDAATTALQTGNNIADKASIGEGTGGSDILQSINDAVDSGISKAQGTVSNVANTAKEAVVGTPEEQVAQKVQSNVDAINPDLSGKAKINAYADIAKNGRGVTPASIFNEQGVEPSQQTVNVATRLSNDIPLEDGSKIPAVNLDSTNHVQNLKDLGTALDTTETAISKNMESADPRFNLDKPGLNDKLDALTTKAPREFIKDPTKASAYQDVLEFAKEKVADTPDTIAGGRDARIAFDAQATKEFPTAFKPDGTIDTKTPAGAAIKAARDTINAQIYNSAPQGGELQKLIGREADIFKAITSVAQKADQGDGKNWFQQAVANNPRVSKTIGTALKLAGVGWLGSKVL